MMTVTRLECSQSPKVHFDKIWLKGEFLPHRYQLQDVSQKSHNAFYRLIELVTLTQAGFWKFLGYVRLDLSS